MDQRAPSEGQYRFGPFQLDPPTRLLTRDGDEIPLTYRVFETLLFFVRNPERLLTKDEIMDAVWPGRVVDEGSLTQAVFILRKALAGPTADKGYIATVPGRGYRFDTSVETVISRTPDRPAAEAAVASPTQTAPSSKVRGRTYYYIGAGIIGLLAIAAGIIFFNAGPVSKPKPDKLITMVVGGFQNLSGSAEFDKIFAMVTRIDLRQSPYLKVLSQDDIEDTLDLMTLPKTSVLTPALAREVCARNNGQIAVTGTIAQVGTDFLLTLTATDCVSGRDISDEKSEIATRDELLPALDKMVGNIRQQIGEPTESIEKFGVPMLKHRTASFEALKAFSEAHYAFDRGHSEETIALFKHAIEADPNFAVAYADLSSVYANLHEHDLDVANITKAYALRNNANERDKLYIAMRYDDSVTGDVFDTIRVLREWTSVYPSDPGAWANLANQENWIGEYTAATADGKRALALEPQAEAAYVVVARALLRTGQIDAAEKFCNQAVAKHIDGYDTRTLLMEIAFVHGDDAGIQKQMDWATGKSAERELLVEAGQIAFAKGQVQKGEQIFARALDLGKSFGLNNYMAAPNAELLNYMGYKQKALQSLALVPDPDTADARFTMNEIGDSDRAAETLRADLQKAPHNTLLTEQYAPLEHAALYMRHNQPALAIDALKPAAGLEMRTFDVPYYRGLVYLAANDGAHAADEFRKVLDNRGINPQSVLYPLSQLGYARALRLQGKLAESRSAYETAIRFWKDADPDFPPLSEARREQTQLESAAAGKISNK